MHSDGTRGDLFSLLTRFQHMTWSEVCADPSLQNLLYKIELNEFGQIVMDPVSNERAWRRSEIASILSKLTTDGRLMFGCSIETRSGVRVADVAWLSDSFVDLHECTTPYPAAPELCIDVISPSNSMAEVDTRRALYFESGAQEVWFCHVDGQLKFHVSDGEISRSALVPGFPEKI